MASLPSIQDVLKKYKISADKKLGQNFLFDQNITDKIVGYAGSLENCVVFEVGPGPGVLTRSILAAGAKKVIAIEKDKRCIDALNDYLVPLSDDRLELVEADALKEEVYKNYDLPIKVIANLPYNISTELLIKWLDNIDHFSGFTLMFQREVAARIMAKPRTKQYGRISIKAQWLCDVEHNFDLPPEAFFPPPKVTSSVVTITPRKCPLAKADSKKLEILCRVLFSKRRKVIRSSLKDLIKNPEDVLNEVGIDVMCRPEELSVEDFCMISRYL